MKGNNEYRNCHEYTLDYIAEFAADESLKNAVGQYNRNNPSIEYLELLEKSGKTRQQFYQADCTKLPVPSLILFCTPKGFLQHSMMVIGQDTWAGANNLNSLGGPDDHVHVYPNMSQRNYLEVKQKGKREGGWDKENPNKMRSILGDEYKMYYIPLKVNSAGADYNNRMMQRDEDTGCGCVVM